MKRKCFYLLSLLAFCLLAISCGGDDDDDDVRRGNSSTKNEDTTEDSVNPNLYFGTKDVDKVIVNGVSFNMVRVVGSPYSSSYFYIGETEVTQELWCAVMERNPSYFRGSQLPVETVSWNDCQIFLKKLNEMTGLKFRLPTISEWSFAARGGKKSSGHYDYSGGDNKDAVAWNGNNSKGTTHEVATRGPNELGIYDMSGNVEEWCNDNDEEDDDERAVKGGYYKSLIYDELRYTSHFNKNYRDDSLGFRLCVK